MLFFSLCQSFNYLIKIRFNRLCLVENIVFLICFLHRLFMGNSPIIFQNIVSAELKELVHALGFVACTPEFNEHPKVLNGLSDLFVEVLGERGRHARSAIGSNQLPFNCCVEIEMMARIL